MAVIRFIFVVLMIMMTTARKDVVNEMGEIGFTPSLEMQFFKKS